jgi:HEAT repeat protein
MISNFFLKRKTKKILSTSKYDSYLRAVCSKEYIEPLNALLKDADGTIRLKAAKTLGEIKDIYEINPLIHTLLNDNDKNVKNTAAISLGKIGDKRAIDALISCLTQDTNDDDKELKNTAAISLGKIGDKRAIDALISCLTQDNFEVARALQILGYRPTNDEEWLTYSIAITSSNNKYDILENCDDALNYLSTSNSPNAIIQLIKVYKTVSTLSIYTSVNFDTSKDREKFKLFKPNIENYLIISGIAQFNILISEFLKLNSPIKPYSSFDDYENAPVFDLSIIINNILSSNLSLLDKLDLANFTAMIDKLTTWRTDYFWKIHNLLSLLINKYPASHYLPMFEKYLNDPNDNVQMIAINYLRKKEGRVAELLIKKYKTTENNDIKKIIIIELGEIGDESTVEFLINQIQFEDIKTEVIASLGNIGSSKAITVISALINDKTYQNRAIIEALVNIGGPEVIEPILKALKVDYYVWCILDILGKIKTEIHLPFDAIIPFLKDENSDIRKMAGSLISRYGYSSQDLNEKVLHFIATKQWNDLKICVEKYGSSLSQVLMTYLNDKDSEVREEITNLLTLIKDENIFRQVIKSALVNKSSIITQFIDNNYSDQTKENLLKDIGVYNEYLLMKGEARSCSLCGIIGIIGPWNIESGNDILLEVSSSFYHIVKELSNEWMIWKMCTSKSGDNIYYKEPKYYCPSCSSKSQRWIKDYGTQIVNIIKSSSYSKEPLRKLGYKLYELGGNDLDLMMMTAYYAVYFIGMTRELDFAWNGIGGWQA